MGYIVVCWWEIVVVFWWNIMVVCWRDVVVVCWRGHSGGLGHRGGLLEGHCGGLLEGCSGWSAGRTWWWSTPWMGHLFSLVLHLS